MSQYAVEHVCSMLCVCIYMYGLWIQSVFYVHYVRASSDTSFELCTTETGTYATGATVVLVPPPPPTVVGANRGWKPQQPLRV